MKKIILICTLFIISINTKAQELESLLLAGNDVNKLMTSYVNPVMKGLMYDMNSGWYTTAKTHKKLGFDVTILVNSSFVPGKDKVFSFLNSDYEFLSVAGGSESFPTLMGEDAPSTEVDVSIPVAGNEFRVASFTMPDGIVGDLPINAVPTPMIQVGLGLPTSTDVKLRFIPTIKGGDGEGGLFGVALQHDLMQYFGPLDRLPLNLSVLAGYTTTNVSYNIQENSTFAGSGQEAEFKLNAFTIQAIGSLDFPIVSLYAALGYNSGKSTLKMKGTYELEYVLEDASGVPQGSITETIENPIDLDFKANGMRATLGARLNLGFFKIFGDYTLQEYNTLTAGIAFSFR